MITVRNGDHQVIRNASFLKNNKNASSDYLAEEDQTELIRTFEAKGWHYEKAESANVRIWSQLLKK